MGQNAVFFFFFFLPEKGICQFCMQTFSYEASTFTTSGIQSSLSVSEIEEESSSANEIINFNNHGLVRTKMIK